MKKTKKYLYRKCKTYGLRHCRRYDEAIYVERISKSFIVGKPSCTCRNYNFNEELHKIQEGGNDIIFIDPEAVFQR